VVGHEFNRTLYGNSPLGRWSSPESLAAVTLDDVKSFYANMMKSNDAVLVLAGDVTVERGRELAAKLLEGIKAGDVPAVDYTPPKYAGRKVILIDNPDVKQSVLKVGLPAYDIHTDDKFPGMLAGQILSAGIDSRLGRYVRAEKGYVYGIGASFQPGRHGGTFSGSTETGFDTTAATVDAMFKVFGDLRKDPVLPNELSESKTRVAGAMLMETQTIQQQAGRRVDAILNEYPIDYWDKLPARVNEVTLDQVQSVMNKYVKDDDMTIVVVAPADKVKASLEKFGTVEVLPMPSKRGGTTQPANEMLK